MFYKVGVFKSCVKFKRKQMRRCRVAVFIPATFLQDRLQQINYPVNFSQLLNTLFKKHLRDVASAPSKGFVILQILTNFSKSSPFCSFVIYLVLATKMTYVLFSLLKVVENSLKGDLRSNWQIFHHKLKWHLQKIPNAYMWDTIRVFCMFIRVAFTSNYSSIIRDFLTL